MNKYSKKAKSTKTTFQADNQVEKRLIQTLQNLLVYIGWN